MKRGRMLEIGQVRGVAQHVQRGPPASARASSAQRSTMCGKSRSPHTTSAGAADPVEPRVRGRGSISSPRCSARSAMSFIARNSVARRSPSTRPSGASGPSSHACASSALIASTSACAFGAAPSARASARSRAETTPDLGRAGDRRRDQHERAHALGMRERGVDRDASALRAADQHRGRAAARSASSTATRSRDVRVALVGVQRLAEAAPVVGDARDTPPASASAATSPATSAGRPRPRAGTRRAARARPRSATASRACPAVDGDALPRVIVPWPGADASRAAIVARNRVRAARPRDARRDSLHALWPIAPRPAARLRPRAVHVHRRCTSPTTRSASSRSPSPSTARRSRCASGRALPGTVLLYGAAVDARHARAQRTLPAAYAAHAAARGAAHRARARHSDPAHRPRGRTRASRGKRRGSAPGLLAVVWNLWLSDSEGRQLALLVPGWLHGCLGRQLRLRPPCVVPAAAAGAVRARAAAAGAGRPRLPRDGQRARRGRATRAYPRRAQPGRRGDAHRARAGARCADRRCGSR